MAAQGETILAAGGGIVEILGTHASQSATRDHLDAWIETFDVSVTAMIDAPDSPGQTLEELTVRETLVIVEIPSMEIVWLARGSTRGEGASSVARASGEILRLLGQ